MKRSGSCRAIFVAAAAVLNWAAAACTAHDGPRVWFDVVGGRISMLASDNDIEPSRYYFSRLFRAEFGLLAGIHTTDFPGFEVRRDEWGVQEEAVFRFDIPGPALYFDTGSRTFRSVEEMFSGGGTVPQINVSLGFDSVTTASGPVDGFDFFTFFGEGTHVHMYFTLLGDGVSVEAPVTDGVYALPMRMSSDGLGDSPTFYILLGMNVPTDSAAYTLAFDGAFRQFARPIVPEPGAALPLSGGAIMLLGRRRDGITHAKGQES